jgi:hypothetical protein
MGLLRFGNGIQYVRVRNAAVSRDNREVRNWDLAPEINTTRFGEREEFEQMAECLVVYLSGIV